MKYVVMELNIPNELVMFTNSILGNDSFNVCATKTCFGEFHAETIEETAINTWLETLPRSRTDELPYNMIDDRANFVEGNSFDITSNSLFWTLYFDGCNCLEGAGAGSILVNPLREQHSMAS